MNIVSVKSTAEHHEYNLNEEDKLVLRLRYMQERHTARIETEKERRVLIIEDEGLLRTLLVLKNEYGVRIGSLTYDNFSITNGIVDIENNKYRFSVNQTDSPELKIYKGSRKNLIYSCSISHENNSSKATMASLIIAVSWYLFLKEERRIQHAFHEAVIL